MEPIIVALASALAAGATRAFEDIGADSVKASARLLVERFREILPRWLSGAPSPNEYEKAKTEIEASLRQNPVLIDDGARTALDQYVTALTKEKQAVDALPKRIGADIRGSVELLEARIRMKAGEAKTGIVARETSRLGAVKLEIDMD